MASIVTRWNVWHVVPAAEARSILWELFVVD
jgi:hypothetical protein